MIALVTGSSGFVGGFLTAKLAAKDCQVHCLVRKTSSLEYLKDLPVNFIYGDLFSFDALSTVMAEITHVFHLAGVTSALTPGSYFRINGTGTCNLLRACARQAKRLQRFVYISSQAAAGPSPNRDPVREDDEPRPVSIYGRSKLDGEICCAELASQLPITIIRSPIVYGPRDTSLYRYLKHQSRSRIRLHYKRHLRLNSLIHIDDLVRGILTAAVHPDAAGNTYFMANPQPYSLTQLLDTIAELTGSKTISIPIPLGIVPIIAPLFKLYARLSGKPTLLNAGRLPEMRYPFWVCSAEKARKQLGFTTSLSLPEGLRQTLEWYRKNEC